MGTPRLLETIIDMCKAPKAALRWQAKVCPCSVGWVRHFDFGSYTAAAPAARLLQLTVPRGPTHRLASPAVEHTEQHQMKPQETFSEYMHICNRIGDGSSRLTCQHSELLAALFPTAGVASARTTLHNSQPLSTHEQALVESQHPQAQRGYKRQCLGQAQRPCVF
jgi:hypothetical protein